MNLISKIATAGAVAAMGLGLSAAGASANIALDYDNAVAPGGHYTGTQVGINSFTAGTATVTCTGATFTGDTDDATTTKIPFRAGYSGCHVNFAGFQVPATVTTHSDWELEYVSGSAASGITADVNIKAPASGPAVTIQVPAIGCTISVAAQSGLSSVDATNNASPTSVDLSASVSGIAYTATSGCLGVPSSGSDATYVGDVHIPGITITDA